MSTYTPYTLLYCTYPGYGTTPLGKGGIVGSQGQQCLESSSTTAIYYYLYLYYLYTKVNPYAPRYYRGVEWLPVGNRY